MYLAPVVESSDLSEAGFSSSWENQARREAAVAKAD